MTYVETAPQPVLARDEDVAISITETAPGREVVQNRIDSTPESPP